MTACHRCYAPSEHLVRSLCTDCRRELVRELLCFREYLVASMDAEAALMARRAVSGPTKDSCTLGESPEEKARVQRHAEIIRLGTLDALSPHAG